MAIRTAAQLKAYFVTGATPTQSQFEDLIDTIFSFGAIYVEFTGVTTSIQSDYLKGIDWSRVLVIFSGTEQKTTNYLTVSNFNSTTGTISWADDLGGAIVELIIKP